MAVHGGNGTSSSAARAKFSSCQRQVAARWDAGAAHEVHQYLDHPIGLERGRFEANDPLATMLAAGGAVLAIIAGRLQGDIGADAPERAATVVLSLVGLREKEAANIARRPLPAIAAPQYAATGEQHPAEGRRRVRSAP
jgi:hypothetical protein